MPVIATCAALVMALNGARGGEAFNLAKGNDCPPMLIKRVYAAPVRIDTTGSQIRGLTIRGGNLIWRGGTFRAVGGKDARARPGYGITLEGSSRTTFERITVTDAKKGMVLDHASDVTVADSLFAKVGEDGIIANASQRVQILRNVFRDTVGKPTECDTGGGVQYSLPQRACPGTWRDGYHPDAVQFRNGMADVLLKGNTVTGATQGLSQMEATGDAPSARIVIEENTITTDGYHRITVGPCKDCVIRRNIVRRAPGSAKKAVIISGMAATCGNSAQDARVADRHC